MLHSCLDALDLVGIVKFLEFFKSKMYYFRFVCYVTLAIPFDLHVLFLSHAVVIFFNHSWFYNFQVNLSMLSRYLIQMIGSLFFMFSLNASLTGVLLAVVPIVSLSAVQYGKLVNKQFCNFKSKTFCPWFIAFNSFQILNK